MKKLLTLILVLCALHSEAQEIAGKILNEYGQPVVIGVVLVKQNGVLKDAACSNYDGFYLVKPLAPGYYDVTTFYSCYDTITTTRVLVGNGGTTTVNFNLTQSTTVPRHIVQPYKRSITELLQPAEETKPEAISISSVQFPQCHGRHGNINIGGCREVLYIIDGIQIVPIQPIPSDPALSYYHKGLGLVNLTPKEIAAIPALDLRDMVALAPHVYQRQRGADLNIAGAGAYGTLYVIDGMQIAR